MSNRPQITDTCFTQFKTSVNTIPLPNKFTFPFYYEPHPLCEIAAQELQEFIENQTDWEWDFHNQKGLEGICMGKMFGVLIVQNEVGDLGYLSAFSGKIAGKNNLTGFVPPVYDMLTDEGFFLQEMKKLNVINDKIKELDTSQEFKEAKEFLEKDKQQATQQLQLKKQELKEAKNQRKLLRIEAKEKLLFTEFEDLEKSLVKESLQGKHELRELNQEWDKRIQLRQTGYNEMYDRLIQLKKNRKAKSASIQTHLFNQYQFLNIQGNKKGLIEIFESTAQKKPPAAAGECAAPKLLQYAFLHNLKPIAMAEFWLGQSPNTEIRKHGHFYPSCRGKCEPILGHMLKGMEVDENPMLVHPELNKPIEIVYEDDSFAAINKPHEFLSVPGKNIQESVYERMKLQLPDATGPLIVHRLDMATSGLMLIAKTNEAYKRLQGQFIKRRVKKTYVALLDGVITEDEGEIDLPLRVDLDDRPRQMVCYEHGKPAQTKWKVIDRNKNKTRIYFSPVTGRTHQLRVHAAHPLGLNTPIVGDDLYGTKATRLYLHAQSIEFFHPTTNEWMRLEVKAGF